MLLTQTDGTLDAFQNPERKVPTPVTSLKHIASALPTATRRSSMTREISKGKSPVISTHSLKTSLVLDFESLKDGDPLLAGTLTANSFHQVVLDQQLKSAGDKKGLLTKHLSNYCHQLLDHCEEQDRLIIAYSTKELTDLERITGRRAAHRYVNALTLAKIWRKRFFPEEHDQVKRFRQRVRQRGNYLGGRGNQLLDFTGLINIYPPRDYGKGCEAARLRHVLNQLSRRSEYGKLTPVAKAKWTKALKHNEFDVRALNFLCQRIVSDFGWK